MLDRSSPRAPLAADFYPAGEFRLSGGVLISPGSFDLSAELTEATDVGDNVYTPAEVGTIGGTVSTNTASPYVGIGFGNAAARSIGFLLDLGVAFHGNPRVTATANGMAASDPQFQLDLDAEVQELADELKNWVVTRSYRSGCPSGWAGRRPGAGIHVLVGRDPV